MTKDVIIMAQEAQFWKESLQTWGCAKENLERFAAIVIEDFLTRSGQYLTNDASREAAIAVEREACAKLAEEAVQRYYPAFAEASGGCLHVAAAIRARGRQ